MWFFIIIGAGLILGLITKPIITPKPKRNKGRVKLDCVDQMVLWHELNGDDWHAKS
jgi:hypothetical protein